MPCFCNCLSLIPYDRDWGSLSHIEADDRRVACPNYFCTVAVTGNGSWISRLHALRKHVDCSPRSVKRKRDCMLHLSESVKPYPARHVQGDGHYHAKTCPPLVRLPNGPEPGESMCPWTHYGMSQS